MPRTGKPLRPLDLAVVDVFEDAFTRLGVSRNSVIVKAGIGNNRSGTIFRKEGPGITMAETEALAFVIGMKASEVIAEAEARLAASAQAAPQPEVVRIPAPGDPDFEPIPPSEEDVWRLAANFTREDVERSRLEEIGEESQLPPEERDDHIA